jgi:hypothetical protein
VTILLRDAGQKLLKRDLRLGHGDLDGRGVALAQQDRVQPVPLGISLLRSVMPPDFFGWKTVDLAVVAAAQSEAEARRLADEEAQLPFEIAKGPLLRVTLLRIAPEAALV